MQNDDNLVLYHGSRALWATSTDGSGAKAAQLQEQAAEAFDASWKDLLQHIDQQVS